ncbi:putative response regulatory protein [Clostridium saccharobutylicum]|uniref:response regulator transcription factor n=1 Tax=Clostridium saccharobutylicum TaxID=169679 RepID=UPI000983B2A3|nr:response regulator [Clostridium saccharobutylicum]AQS11426.1 putative response regulatory protein [Clostridium saccharobutylicum]MBC2435170.1 response regulator [Clostridium saccharobutylicum]NSB88649.1 two-component system response regulator YesN [Clostridium saccharobutylicum]NYC30594.1 two-component system response regulator YesN [Clostridium saccharobutylicum]OOM12214.1 putative response regulatory protein [Clostridium saccharobutylicum]
MYKVMIVDDMEIARLQLKRLKIWGEVSGFEITDEARNGYEAIQKLQTNSVDLIITDIRMPIVDGVELLEEVMKKKLALCVVLFSGYSEFEYARKGLVLGAFDYLIKPVNADDINKLLERAKLFISEKKEEKKLKVYNHSLDVTQILELIENGRTVENLAYSIFDKLVLGDFDKIRMHHIIIEFFEEVLEAINNNMIWFIKFADVSYIKSLNLHDVASLEQLRDIYISCIKNLEAQIMYLYLAKSYGVLINKVSIFILNNVENEVTLSTIASYMDMNKNYLCEIFKKKTGMSLLDYMTKVKMERAKKMLRESEDRSYEIADKLGYRDPEYFSRLFKKYSGMSPTAYRKLKK